MILFKYIDIKNVHTAALFIRAFEINKMDLKWEDKNEKTDI